VAISWLEQDQSEWQIECQDCAHGQVATSRFVSLQSASAGFRSVRLALPGVMANRISCAERTADICAASAGEMPSQSALTLAPT
jgi:hypothetical protein